MELSRFGERFTARTGILGLMEDLSEALNGDEHMCMLGGGNPALIPEVSNLWRSRMQEILDNRDQFERMVGAYDTPKGNQEFLDSLAALLHREYGWNLDPRNIGVTNGSQTAFFFLLNLFKGKILFPLCPEYIGYADQAIEPDSFVSYRPSIHEIGDNTFKYGIDFSNIEITDDIGAICISRPTNPTGNVVTDEELEKLSALAESHDIPLMVDNAYGSPFPGIIYEDVHPLWNENIILGMSLSKIGLPSSRSGIIIAREEIIEAVAAVNAICSLSIGNIGQILIEPLISSGEIVRVSREIVKPYYLKRSLQTQDWLHQALRGTCDYAIHKSEGAFFLWIWFKDLKIGTMELYERLKQRNVLVIPGRYFFFDTSEGWRHQDECIRLTYSQREEDVRRGIEILADVIREIQ